MDCWGAAQPAVRYDSPTWGGFSFEVSYGKNTLTAPKSIFDDVIVREPGRSGDPDSGHVRLYPVDTGCQFADLALIYTADWNSIKLAAAYTFTWIETGRAYWGRGQSAPGWREHLA